DTMAYQLSAQLRVFDIRSAVELGKRLQAIELLGFIALIEEALPEILHATETVGLAGHSHGLHVGKARVRHVQQGVLLGAIQRHFIGAAAAVVHKLDFYLLPYPLEVAVTPYFEWKRLGLSSTLFGRALVRTAHGMGIDAVRLAVHDVNTATIGTPARNA